MGPSHGGIDINVDSQLIIHLRMGINSGGIYYMLAKWCD